MKPLSNLFAAVAMVCAVRIATASAQPLPPPDDVQRLLLRVESVTGMGDARAFGALFHTSADERRSSEFIQTEIQPGATRAVVRERDRAGLPSAQLNRGYRLTVDTFVQFGQRARVATWRLDVERQGDTWLLVDAQRLTSVENLFRLSLDPSKQYDAHRLSITAEDLDLSLESGQVFVADTGLGVTALVLLGRGEMRFHPRPETEKGQVKIFCGQETLTTRFDSLYLRINPFDFGRLVSGDQLVARPVDPRDFHKANDVFVAESPKAYQLGLGDLSSEAWWSTPLLGDLVAEIRTRRFGTLTYARSGSEPEDITLFDRKKHKNISVYASTEKIERRGPSFNEDDLSDYDVLDYNLDVAVFPERQWIDGVAQLLIRVRRPTLSTLSLRLSDSLVVRSIVSSHFGPLFGFRVKNSGSVIINLPATLSRDTLTTVTIVYGGRIESQSADREAIAVGQDVGFESFTPEPHYLYSNRNYWYPQSTTSDYATATIKISVPAAYDCVASGELQPGSPATVGTKDDPNERKVYAFSAAQPLRYLAFVVSRFTRSDTLTILLPDDAKGGAVIGPPTGQYYEALNVSVEANPRQTRRGRELIDRAADIAQFYASLLADCPFPSFTLALVESELPGGHSPGYFAVLNQALPNSQLVWRNDPTAFERYPDFFLAHELAHQWWGQAVGWRNYHEQWLSEGFAQYFAALYAEHDRGPDVFTGILRRMRKSALENSDQGPVYLGYRLGHIQEDSRIFRALVYNKGAMVLHMLRRLVGDEPFFRGLRRFYATARFRKTGTEEFKHALEAEAGRSLDRFFDQWVYGSSIPVVKMTYRVDGDHVAVHVEQDGVADLPLTLTLEYADKKRVDVAVALRGRTTDVRVPLAGALRTVDPKLDDGPLATYSR